MSTIKVLARRFWEDEQGLEMSEYAVMVALIVVAIFTVLGLLRDAIIAKFQALVDILK